METLERKYEFELSKELKKEIRELEEEFLSEFWKFVPKDIERAEICASNMSKQLGWLASKRRKKGCGIVSLDKVYLPGADEYLEATRLTNPKTGKVELGARPGNKSLQQQISELKEKYNKIVLSDVGAFGGGTLETICGLLEEKGVEIEESLLGVCSREAYNRLNGASSLKALNLFDFYEWIELRDFFGIDGRNIGQDDDEVRLFIPYWENLSEWASIPKRSNESVASLCKEYNQKLVEKLEKQGIDLSRIGKLVKYGGGGVK